MIKSMTGYGRGESSGPFGIITVELKSLNNKFFDMNTKIPTELSVSEDRIREYIQRHIKRGRITVSVFYAPPRHRHKRIRLDKELASALVREITRFKKGARLKGDVDINHIVTFPGVLQFSDIDMELPKLWRHTKKALDVALVALEKSRGREGRHLAHDLSKRVGRIKRHTLSIERRAATNVHQYKKNFSRRVKELSGGLSIDKGRLEQEVAVYAKNCDITEELIRIKSHAKSFEKALHAKGEKGKRLDFMAQEFMREANTIGAKSSDFQIANHVIKIKSEIEKIREQLKNIE